MAVHLTRIYTRTGDDGTSSLSDFSRVTKSDPRLIAYADCDEANAAIGVAVALGGPDERLPGHFATACGFVVRDFGAASLPALLAPSRHMA